MAEKRLKRKINNEFDEKELSEVKNTRSRDYQWWFTTNKFNFVNLQADLEEIQPAKNILNVKEYLSKFLAPISNEMLLDNKDN